MTTNNSTEITDEALLEKAKKMKATTITNAVLTGVMIGIATYSTVRNGLGLMTFIPVIFALKVFNDSKNKKELEQLLKDRNLK